MEQVDVDGVTAGPDLRGSSCTLTDIVSTPAKPDTTTEQRCSQRAGTAEPEPQSKPEDKRHEGNRTLRCGPRCLLI